MSEHRVATITNHRNGSVTIAGLTRDDCLLISRAIDAGAFEGGDKGGDLSLALVRLSCLLRTPAVFPEQHAPVKFQAGGTDAATLYDEIWP